MDTEKYKRVCEDFPNFAILTKSATPGKVQLTFGHGAIVKKSLGESVVDFALSGDLSSPYVISLKIDIAFSADGDKIRIPIAEFLLRAATGNLAHLKKQRDWTPRNAVLLPPFITEAAILHGELEAGELLKIFSRSITEWAKKGETSRGEDDDNGKDSIITINAEDEKTAKPGKAKNSTANMLATIADDCGDVLAFLQAVAVKSPRFIAAPLSLCADKRARMVPSLDRLQPPHATQAGSTRPHGSHGIPERRGNPVSHHGSAPPRRCLPARGGKGDQGVGPSPTNSPARYPVGEPYHRNLHFNLSASHNPPLPQHEECDGPPG